MGQHYSGPGAPVSKQQQAKTDEAAERIGKGDQLTAEDWPLLTETERMVLADVNRDKYRELRDGNPAGAWRPSVHGQTQGGVR